MTIGSLAWLAGPSDDPASPPFAAAPTEPSEVGAADRIEIEIAIIDQAAAPIGVAASIDPEFDEDEASGETFDLAEALPVE